MQVQEVCLSGARSAEWCKTRGGGGFKGWRGERAESGVGGVRWLRCLRPAPCTLLSPHLGLQTASQVHVKKVVGNGSGSGQRAAGGRGTRKLSAARWGVEAATRDGPVQGAEGIVGLNQSWILCYEWVRGVCSTVPCAACPSGSWGLSKQIFLPCRSLPVPNRAVEVSRPGAADGTLRCTPSEVLRSRVPRNPANEGIREC